MEMRSNDRKERKMEFYESIIQNLTHLKKEANEYSHDEAEAIEAIQANLSTMRDSLHQQLTKEG